MSLWRIRHRLSPIAEAALIALATCVGVAVIWLASVRPLAVSVTEAIHDVPGAIPLDTDAWPRYRNDAETYLYAAPPGWLVDDHDPAQVVVARNRAALVAPHTYGTKITVSAVALGPREKITDLEASDFSGLQPAVYAVNVAGHEGLFVIVFSGGRVAQQAAYVLRGRSALVIRGDGMSPSAFAAFVGAVRFFTP